MTSQVVGVGIGKLGPTHDPGVVDEDVDLAELLDGAVDERGRARLGCDVVPVGDTADRGRDVRGYAGVGARTVDRAAQIVDDDGRASLREQFRVRAADTASGAGDDRDAPVEAIVAQTGTFSRPSSPASVPPSIAARSSPGMPANWRAMSSLLPRNVPSACG
jgi:hypothetical protein